MKTRIKLLVTDEKTLYMPQRKVFWIFWSDSFPYSFDGSEVISFRSTNPIRAKEFIQDIEDCFVK